MILRNAQCNDEDTAQMFSIRQITQTKNKRIKCTSALYIYNIQESLGSRKEDGFVYYCYETRKIV